MSRGLTSFRAFAFFAVFIFHAIGGNAGYLGVQAFFVLSGFLLTPILMDMKRDLNSKSYFVNFYGRRALRIFPLYYLYLLLTTIICLFIINTTNYTGIRQIDHFIAQLPWSLTYTYNFFHASDMFPVYTPLASHFWSLAVEEQFYLIWPLLLFFIHRKYLKIFLLITIFMGPIFRYLIATIVSNETVPLLQDHIAIVIYVLPFSYFDAFAIGGFFALYQSSKPSYSTWLAIIVVLIISYSTQYLTKGSINIPTLGFGYFMADNYIWGYSMVSFLFAFMLVQIRDKKFIPLLFENKQLDYLGQISYGMYVFHFPILWAMTFSPLHLAVQMFIALLLTILISAISYEFMEKRFISLKDTLFSKEARKEAYPSARKNNSD